MSSIALGMQVNDLEARIVELERLVAMMRHAIDVAVLPQNAMIQQATIHPQEYVQNTQTTVKPAKVKATRA